MREHAKRRWRTTAGIALVGVFAVLLFFRNMDRDLNHDEHQFLAPGALIARNGLLPYRDFPLFHVPIVPLLYAAADRIYPAPILWSRIISVIATSGTVAVLVWQCYRIPMGVGFRFGAACISIIYLSCNPIFAFTTGKAWNHEIPAFCICFALAAQIEACRKSSAVWESLAGISVGLAMGARSTVVPAVLPLCIAPLFINTALRERIRLVTLFIAGVCAGLLPTLYFFVKAPDAFLFGNLEFPRLRLLDPDDLRVQKTVTLWRKLRFFWKEIILPSWPLAAAYLGLQLYAGKKCWTTRNTGWLPNVLCLAVFGALTVGCFAPSRYHPQHCYVVIPIAVAGVVFALQTLTEPYPRWLIASLTTLAGIGFVISLSDAKPSQQRSYQWLSQATRPEKWFPMRARAVGEEIRAHVPEGKVLTLAPAWPVEGGLSIYPEFATGVFAWRAAHLVDETRRRKFKLVGPDDLESLLRNNPPAAILTGVEDEEMEKPLVAYALKHQFRPVEVAKRRRLWLPGKGAGGQGSSDSDRN